MYKDEQPRSYESILEANEKLSEELTQALGREKNLQKIEIVMNKDLEDAEREIEERKQQILELRQELGRAVTAHCDCDAWRLQMEDAEDEAHKSIEKLLKERDEALRWRDNANKLTEEYLSIATRKTRALESVELEHFELQQAYDKMAVEFYNYRLKYPAPDVVVKPARRCVIA
jgi:DNA repair exonuclease SbcCD ATPase subunit